MVGGGRDHLPPKLDASMMEHRRRQVAMQKRCNDATFVVTAVMCQCWCGSQQLFGCNTA
jgi:hypothetical protein